VAQSRATSPPIDPADAMLVMFEESGANPSSPGPAGANPPVSGLNQMATPNLTALGLTHAQWLSMSAAQQLPYVFRFWKSLSGDNGGRFASDAGQLLALNFLPGAYKAVNAGSNGDAVIAGKNGPYAWAYNDNPALQNATGTITVNTLRAYMANVASKGGVRWAALLAGIAAAEARVGYKPLQAATAPSFALLALGALALGGIAYAVVYMPVPAIFRRPVARRRARARQYA